jgi:3-dehydroquinate synthetase
LLSRLRVPVDPPRIPSARWIELMQRDKKVSAGRINFILLRGLGDAVVANAVTASDIEALMR